MISQVKFLPEHKVSVIIIAIVWETGYTTKFYIPGGVLRSSLGQVSFIARQDSRLIYLYLL